MHCFSTAGSFSAAHTCSREAGIRWLSFICMIGVSLSACSSIGGELAAPAFPGDLGEDRHRDLLRRDGAEIETCRRLDVVDGGGGGAFRNELGAERGHLAAAADEGVIVGFYRYRRAQGGFVALALRRDYDEALCLVEFTELV